MASAPYDRLPLGRSDRPQAHQNRWPVKANAMAYRNPYWRVRSLPGGHRPLRTAKPVPPNLSRIFTLLGQSAPADDGEDEESDSFWLTE